MSQDAPISPNPPWFAVKPDAKSQVTLQYEGGVPVRATALVVSTQHSADCSNEAGQAKLRDYVKGVFASVLPEGWLPGDEAMYVNPTGLFEIGGPDGDAGVTGRKIIVDTYGGAARMAAAPFRARTRPRSTGRQPMSRAIWRRTSSRLVSQNAARSSCPTRSGSPSRCRSMSICTAPGRSARKALRQCCRSSCG